MDINGTDEELAAVQAAFDAIGADIEVEASVFRFSNQDSLPWIVYLTLLAQHTVGDFFKAAAKEAGKRAGADIYELLKSIAKARKVDRGSIVVRDGEHTSVTLVTGLPPEAIAQLDELDWPAYRGERLFWDFEQGRWTT
jgi:hypothetical protein